MMKAKILIVEDDPSVLKLGMTILKKLGHEVLCAMTSNEAYQLIIAESPDAIALDVMLPDMDGFTLAKKLKEDARTRHIPIAFVTAKTEPTDMVEGFNCGGAIYLTKPFTVNALKTAIESLLRQKQARLNKR